MRGRPGPHPLEATFMKFSRRSLLLLIAVVCFVLAAVGVGFTNISLTSIGLAAFAGAFLVEEGGLLG